MPALLDPSPESAPDWLFIDDDLLVVDKPSGMLSVPGRSELDCMAARVQAHVPDALIVHRLDMATSGLMLFARGKAMQQRLSQAFARREVHKRYVAVVEGLVERDHGEIDLPLIADWPQRPRQKVDHDIGKPSLTRYQVLQRDDVHGRTALSLEPVTGRSHQLRVHLLAIGHPILGDALYAPPEVQAKSPRLLLHAQSLVLKHPRTGNELRVSHDPPFAV
jgi:tRNA pseudouridine32 synthase/23S rRNA pseudouridine746 synthase